MAIRRKDGSWHVAKQPNGDWHPEEVKSAVRMSQPRMTLQRLAREQGLHPHACHHAIAKPHYLGELAIAGFLGTTPQAIWPSRHEADGTRYCQVRVPVKSMPPQPTGHCEFRGAA